MKFYFHDYNFNESFISSKQETLGELDLIVSELDIFLKNSDQQGKKQSLIFDPIGTNHSLKELLSLKNWVCNLKIPNKFNSLGKDIDFYKDNVLLEVQFSNYPFLLNNIIRSELFHKNEAILNKKIHGLIIITKVHAFPSSNSTLYYEQAKKQIDLLAENNLFTIPLRLIGLSCDENNENLITWTEYKAQRYSREIFKREKKTMKVIKKKENSFFIFE